MTIVRSRREQLHQRKLAAEQAVYWCTIRLCILQEKLVGEQVIGNGATELQTYQAELSTAIEDLSRADLDIGVVRIVLRRKGLPLTQGSAYAAPALEVIEDTHDTNSTDQSEREDSEGP